MHVKLLANINGFTRGAQVRVKHTSYYSGLRGLVGVIDVIEQFSDKSIGCSLIFNDEFKYLPLDHLELVSFFGNDCYETV